MEVFPSLFLSVTHKASTPCCNFGSLILGRLRSCTVILGGVPCSCQFNWKSWSLHNRKTKQGWATTVSVFGSLPSKRLLETTLHWNLFAWFFEILCQRKNPEVELFESKCCLRIKTTRWDALSYFPLYHTCIIVCVSATNAIHNPFNHPGLK